MITQKIRVVAGTAYSNILVGNESNLFTNLQLNALTIVPAWVSLNVTPGYILKFNISGAQTVGIYYIYLTLGGSPSIEDALLIIEVIDALTDTSETCFNSRTYIIDSVTNEGGKARVNLLYEFDSQPKVGEYIFISSGSNYSGYYKVYNSDINSVTLDLSYVGALTGTPLLYTFNFNNSICLVWINRQGGRSSIIFDQRRDYGFNTGDAKTFDNGTDLNYITRGKGFENKTVYKSGVTNDEIELISSLRTSIAVWEYDANTDVCTPVIIDSNSFNKYTTKQNYNEVSIKYRVATYKTTQIR